MIIHWKGDGILVIPIVDEKGKSLPIEKGNVISLIPGYNEINDDAWVHCKRHVHNHLANEKIEELAKEDKDENGKTVFRSIPLRRISSEKAMAIIKDCFSLRTLNGWLEDKDEKTTETRETVLKAIHEQIHKINTGGKEEQPSTVALGV